jgi:glycine cleavage system H protein
VEYPDDLRYSKEHEWARAADGRVTIGITEYAQDALGEVVYVELPRTDSEVTKEATFGVIESVKAVSDLYSPITGKVVEVNSALIDTPEMVNSEPYGDGWLIVAEPADVAELDELMSAKEYEEFVESEKKKG